MTGSRVGGGACLALWVCPQSSRGIDMGKSWGRQEEMRSFRSFCLLFPSFPSPSQRGLRNLCVAEDEWEPPATVLAAGPTITPLTQHFLFASFLHRPPTTTPCFCGPPPRSDALMDDVLVCRAEAVLFGYGCPVKSKRGERKGTTHTALMLLSPPMVYLKCTPLWRLLQE